MIRNLIAGLSLMLLCALPVRAEVDDTDAIVDPWIDAYERFDLDAFLAFYAEDTRFEDPTAQIMFASRNELKAAYVGIMNGRWGGNFEFDRTRTISQGDTIVMEGLFSLTWNGEKAAINFTTWLEIKDGKIQRQLDLFDYNALRRQIEGYGQGLPAEYTDSRD